MSQTRRQFLQEWNYSYPEAPPNCLSTSAFKSRLSQHGFSDDKHWVAGRVLGIDTSLMVPQIVIADAFKSLTFEVAPEVVDLEGFAYPWHLTVSPGDQVALRIQQNSSAEEIAGRVESLLFLTPAISEWKPLKVDQELFLKWPRFLRSVKSFFLTQDFFEVETPSLVTCPGVEPELIPFATELRWGDQRTPLFLPTSPEIHLKKLLMQGYPQIFEIKRCFRNEEISDTHQPEFHMLEWYRAYSNLDAITEDFSLMIRYLKKEGFVSGEVGSLERISVAEIFLKYLDFHLTPETSRDALVEELERRGMPFSKEDSWDDLFHLLFLGFVEPKIGLNQPLLVYNYPSSQAALARINAEGWSDRFEIYWRGMEIANAFHELNDPVEQEKRWLRDQRLRADRGRPQVPLDFDFLQGMRAGMPPSGGIALGLERLFLAAQGEVEIQKTKAFPHRERLR